MGSRAGSRGADQGLERQIELVRTEPGRPTQNVFVENFHGKLRDECLNASWFGSLFEARVKIGAWKEEYNEERPHSSLGYLTPRAFSRRMAALRSQIRFDRADIVRDVRLSWQSLFEWNPQKPSIPEFLRTVASDLLLFVSFSFPHV